MMDTERDYEVIIKRIREEANSVKNCFTKFSFHAIAFSGLMLSAIAAYQPKQPFVGLAGLFIIIVVLIVSRIGNYKYATANRHFGFELYQDSKQNSKQNKKNYQEIGWEEGLRAWRVVQATIFDEVYYTRINTKFWDFPNRLRYNRVKKKLKKKLKKPEKSKKSKNPQKIKRIKDYDYIAWFNPTSLLINSAEWYPGRYLHTMQSILHIFAFFSLFPLIIMCLQLQFGQNESIKELKNIIWLEINPIIMFCFIITIVTTIFVFIKIYHIHARRKILESGLLSIHSCAIVWHVVELAHFEALNKTNSLDQTDYLRYLSEEAREIKEYAHNIYEWVNMVQKDKK